MELELLEMWAGMGTPVKAVVIFLTLQAVACIAVVIDRLIMLQISMSRSRRFAIEAQRMMEAGDYEGVVALAQKIKGSHLADYLSAGLQTYVERRDSGVDAEKVIALTRRALERKGESIGQELHRGMNVLASTGSTAPFVGLLGTVLGIINAFRLIAATGGGGIGTIGSAIGEALVVTGYGLVVAIPSVLVFNWLSGRLAAYESGLLEAGGELVDELDGGFELRKSCEEAGVDDEEGEISFSRPKTAAA
jgi:biopolymer transport protein ExbB/TolQ